MLRLDVAVPDDDPRGYSVPAGNPFIGRGDALPEIWALGYRNPWRFAFDDVGEGATGAMVVGDVGQNQREEIDYEPAGAAGRNYGWRLREGTVATPGVPVAVPSVEPLVEPIVDYGRGRGQSVTGGYVYRGTALPAGVAGRYFFGDFGSGRIWSLGLQVDPETREAIVVDEIEHTSELGGAVAGLASFARDLAGELYIVLHGGEVYRLAAPDRAAEAEDEDGGVASAPRARSPILNSGRSAPACAPMEKIIVHAKFHTGHRQLGYPGECRFVHGHTWRGTVIIATEAFPRDELDMSLDFGHIKDVMRDLDHKMLVVESDATFMDASRFEPEGVVVLKGKGPSVENVATYVYERVVERIGQKYPGRGLAYRIEVTIQETENNLFVVDRTATV